jgi:hypothetical protein
MSFRLFQVAALAATMFVCAPSSAASGGIKDPSKGVPADHGIFVVAVNINSLDPDRSASAWRQLQIISVNEKPKVFITDEVLGEKNGTVVFTGYAPAGKYRLNQLYTWGAGYTHWAPFGEALGGFELQPGRVTVVGLVLVQPAGQRYYMTRVPMPQGAIDYVRSVYATQLEKFKPQEPVLAADWPKNAAAVLSLAQRNAPFARSITIASDGTVLAPAKLGQVQRLESDERWVPRPTGGQLDMISLAACRSGGYIVGGEFGSVRRARALHEAWQDLQLPAGEGSVHAVAEAANGDLYAVSYHGLRPEPYTWGDFWAAGSVRMMADLPLVTQLRVWKRSPTDSAWQLARELDLAKDYEPMVASDGRTLYLSPAPFALERFDVDAAKWETLAIPVDTLTLQPNGMLSGVTRKKGPFPQISNDGGHSWVAVQIADEEKRTKFKPLGPLVLVGPDQYVARGRLSTKGKWKDAPLFMTSDAGKSWSEMSGAASACYMVTDIIGDGDKLWVLCASEQVFGWDRTAQEFKPQREFALP